MMFEVSFLIPRRQGLKRKKLEGYSCSFLMNFFLLLYGLSPSILVEEGHELLRKKKLYLDDWQKTPEEVLANPTDLLCHPKYLPQTARKR